MKVIKLPIAQIAVALYDNGPAIIESDLAKDVEPDEQLFLAAVDTLESFILAAAVAGIDIESPQFLEAIQTTIDAIGNNYG